MPAFLPAFPAGGGEMSGLESFSGTGWYERTVTLDGGRVMLDLGEVREFAEVEVNGRSVGTRLWPPFQFEAAVERGENTIRIGVTNTRANELTEKKLPSGLFGPVRIQSRFYRSRNSANQF